MRKIVLLFFALACFHLYCEEEENLKQKELKENVFLKGKVAKPPEEILHWIQSREQKETQRKTEFPRKTPPTNLSLKCAITTTLNYQWDIEIAQREIGRKYGVWQESAGPFDPQIFTSVLNEKIYDAQQPGFKTNKSGSETVLKFAVEKLTRIGTRFSVRTEIDRIHDPSLLFSDPFTRYNQSTLNFTIEQPLLRRFIYNQEAVDEYIASLQFNASRYLFLQAISKSVLDTIFAYWEVLSAEKIVEINRSSKGILEGLASATLGLVEGEHYAAAELNEQIAELARNERELVSSQQFLYEVYLKLLLLMGESICYFGDDTPSLILDQFPFVKEAREPQSLDCLLKTAYYYRGDLIASRIQVQESNLRLRLAQKNIQPDLDMILGVELQNSTINHSANNFFSSYYPGDAEKVLSAEVRLRFPFWNDAARGNRIKRCEEYFQASLYENEQWSTIYSDIAAAYRDYSELAKEIHWANKAVEWYEITLSDEIQRLKEGYSTLFIVIDYENRLRATLIEQVNVCKQFAQTIARLMYLTGTLVMMDCAHEVKVDPFNFDTVLSNSTIP